MEVLSLNSAHTILSFDHALAIHPCFILVIMLNALSSSAECAPE